MARINYLDGHRGVAILLVLMFHAFSRWPELVPYGNDYSEFPLFKYGYLGVQLFFLISGFVILMTLEKCNNVPSFIYRRWLRLFPAMLICSLIIFLTAGIFTERPNGQPELIDLMAGLSFIDPYIWLKTTGIQLQSIEGAFWSLYVEFKFYVIAAILYFSVGSVRLVYGLFICFITWFSVDFLYQTHSIKALSPLHTVTNILSLKYFGWFSAGAAYYLYIKTNKTKWLILGGGFSLISSLVESKLHLMPFVAAALISLFFTISILSPRLQSLIANKVFLYFGFISYPLYLLHENIMISITIKLGNYVDYIPSYLFPISAIALISVLAYFISKYVEPAIKHGILSSIKKFQYLRGAQL